MKFHEGPLTLATEGLMSASHPFATTVRLLRLGRRGDHAQDLGCGLPLRSRRQTGST